MTHAIPQWLIDKNAARGIVCPATIPHVPGTTLGKHARAVRARVDMVLLDKGIHPITMLPLPTAPTITKARLMRPDKPMHAPMVRMNEIECFEYDNPIYADSSDDCTEGLNTLEFSISIE